MEERVGGRMKGRKDILYIFYQYVQTWKLTGLALASIRFVVVSEPGGSDLKGQAQALLEGTERIWVREAMITGLLYWPPVTAVRSTPGITIHPSKFGPYVSPLSSAAWGGSVLNCVVDRRVGAGAKWFWELSVVVLRSTRQLPWWHARPLTNTFTRKRHYLWILLNQRLFKKASFTFPKTSLVSGNRQFL